MNNLAKMLPRAHCLISMKCLQKMAKDKETERRSFGCQKARKLSSYSLTIRRYWPYLRTMYTREVHDMDKGIPAEKTRVTAFVSREPIQIEIVIDGKIIERFLGIELYRT